MRLILLYKIFMDNPTKKYRQKHKMSLGEFAKMINSSRQLVFWHEKNPDKKWSYRNAVAIDKATFGEIRWMDLVEE